MGSGKYIIMPTKAETVEIFFSFSSISKWKIVYASTNYLIFESDFISPFISGLLCVSMTTT